MWYFAGRSSTLWTVSTYPTCCISTQPAQILLISASSVIENLMKNSVEISNLRTTCT